MNDDYTSKDYMGMVSWSRGFGSSRPMFGTEIRVSNPVTLTVSHAEQKRDLSRDYYFPRKQIVEVEMSPVQWAEFLTSGNTSGVPCTIRYLDGERMSEPDDSEIRQKYDEEINESFGDFSKIEDTIKSALNSGKPMGKRELEKLLNQVHLAVANTDFVKKSFREDMDKIVSKAKAEFNAYVENRIYQIGIEAVSSDSVKFLD